MTLGVLALLLWLLPYGAAVSRTVVLCSKAYLEAGYWGRSYTKGAGSEG